MSKETIREIMAEADTDIHCTGAVDDPSDPHRTVFEFVYRCFKWLAEEDVFELL